ncbi:hypothetical protein [Chitinophaga nivalis]|uniref:Uncharacterized protein n=1 Tax=Chitinophaga nivalis TaxID=2991709 RepID=A0ABT3III5_9BACT|nr:hypothetical protein [Chitinophaga nivalis]MCW3466533.1 hypothetical protein [Chitinophaga nivalis]MCW3483776.1 hypothetical protein [Chitinophaga nivalis]
MSLRAFLPEEQRVIQLKYNSKRIGNYTPEELSVQCKAMVMKIAVITGWQIPDNPEYVTILMDQLRKKFADDYQDLNIDEFEYAMRTYGTHINDWGKGLNLALIDDAICEYLGKRQHLSNLEAQKRANEINTAALPASETDWSDSWEKIKNNARNGVLRTTFISTYVYDWLFRNNMITLTIPERWQVLEECRHAYAREMKEALHASPAANPEGRKKYDLLIKEGDEWRKDKDLWASVVDYSKRETVRIEALNAIANEENDEDERTTNSL